MSFYRGMTCENVTISGDKGTPITAYVAKPSGPGTFPGVVLIHHLPGWSEFYIETTRRFAHHGYLAICADLYQRSGEGNPDEVAAKVRAEGGIPDSQMVGDTESAVRWMRAAFGPFAIHERARPFAWSNRGAVPGAIAGTRSVRSFGSVRWT